MTKEITKAVILQQLQDKFKLREFEPSKFLFDETVIPVYDIAPHLTTWEIITKTVSISSQTNFLFFTVPDDEQWTLRAYQFVFGATGAHKSTGMYIVRPKSSYSIYLDLKPGQELSYLVNLNQHVVLAPGSEVHVNIDTYVSTQSLICRIDVKREEIR